MKKRFDIGLGYVTIAGAHTFCITKAVYFGNFLYSILGGKRLVTQLAKSR